MSKEFITRVAETAVSDWRERQIMLPSVVIAQAILESGWGESELAVKAKALFGIKRHDWTGKTYIKTATEQLKDGTYVSVKNTEWRAYDSWEESILDHNEYIATRRTESGALRYESIIGNTDYKDVCKLLRECGYATSHTYDSKLINLIEQYDLKEYDVTVVKIAIDAGHGLYTAGKRCLKSLDANQTREWFLNDRIADKLQELFKSYNCSVIRTDDTTGTKDVPLDTRCNKANDYGADIFISIHHNAGLNGRSGGGTQVYYSGKECSGGAKRLYDAVVAQTKLVGNRSSKVIDKAFHVLKCTDAEAYLIENGFMDSPEDVPVILSEDHANKTAQGILNFLVAELKLERKPETEILYRVQCGAFRNRANAEALANKLKADGYEVVIVSGSK